MIKACLACDKHGGIGKDGSLPWPKNVNELKYFRDYTLGKIVIMGSNTWKDPNMPSPLPQRTNIVMSKNPESVVHHGVPDVIICGWPETILSHFEHCLDDVIVIGGASVFKAFLDAGFIKEIQLSLIDGDYDCDTHIDLTKLFYDYHVTKKVSENGFSVLTLVRR